MTPRRQEKYRARQVITRLRDAVAALAIENAPRPLIPRKKRPRCFFHPGRLFSTSPRPARPPIAA